MKLDFNAQEIDQLIITAVPSFLHDHECAPPWRFENPLEEKWPSGSTDYGTLLWVHGDNFLAAKIVKQWFANMTAEQPIVLWDATYGKYGSWAVWISIDLEEWQSMRDTQRSAA